jgi:putative spermidine/putrescine transport system permease protein
VRSSTVAVAAISTGNGHRARRAAPMWLLLPVTAFLLVFFLYPLLIILWRSFTDPSMGFENYLALLHDGVSGTVLLRTLRTSLIVAVGTLILAYPYAFAMTVVSARTRNLLTVLVLLPFWTSLMARNFAWYMVLQRGGPINRLFDAIGVHDVVLLGTVAGVTIAMIQVMLPYMVLPLHSGMQGIDRRLLDAGTSLGAPRWRAFIQIYLPLSIPGVVSGFSLVFTMVLGFYITPALLGSPQQSLISQLIATHVTTLLDFGGAGALSAVLLAVTLLVLFAVSRIARPTASMSQAVDRGW